MTLNFDSGRRSYAAVLAACGLAMTLSVVHAADKKPQIKVLVPGTVIQTIEGISFGNDGMLYGTSIHAQEVYRINTQTGAVEVAVPSPDGESDDVAIGPAGTPAAGILAWTAQASGEIRILRPGGKPEVVMRDAPRVNPIAFSPTGRLFTAQSGAGENALWEIDIIGNKPPRVVTKGQVRLNGFGFGSDGKLYAPNFGTDQLIAIDVDTAAITTIAKGVGSPAAAKMDANGDVISVDYMKGDVWRSNPKTGESKMITHVPEPLDSLAIANDGTIYLASAADSSVLAVDPKTGKAREAVRGYFTIALGAGMTTLNGKESVIVADTFGYRFVDPNTGAITRPPWAGNRGASSAVAANERFIAFSYAVSGRVRKIDRQTDQQVVDTAAIKAPRGVALTSTGDVLVADADGNRIVRLNGNDVVDVATNLKQPVELLLENDTSALITEYEAGTISRVDLTTGKRAEIVTGLDHPTGLARLADGRLAVVEPDKGAVSAVDTKTGKRTVLASGLALSLDGHHLPKNTNTGIAVGKDGAIYVTCPADNTVLKILF